jgi:hypothetical protein
MSESIIRAAYEGRLKAWAAARVPALPIEYQNVSFTPPADGSPYLRCFLLPGRTDSEDLAGVHKAFVGVFQISIVTKAGVGQGMAEGIAAELAALFPNNLPLTRSGLTVYVRTPCSTASPVQGDTTSTTPVSFSYRADSI